ncbi:fibronectin type III domain-containing protein, partial [Patescibacteria group bacterium]|nr:fibronectin type III domain-containing protein [Patescibacteria group bacterium]
MMKKSLFKFKKQVAFYVFFIMPIIAFLLVIVALAYLWTLLGGIIFSIIILGVILFLILISHFTDKSIPIFETLLRKEYQRIQREEKNDDLYCLMIYYAALLFGSSKKSLVLVEDTILDEFRKNNNSTEYLDLDKIINQIKNGEEIDRREILSLEEQLVKFHRQNKKRITIKTSIGIAGMILILASSLIYPLSVAKAATYNFNQASWAGGADTVTTANHTSNQSDWTKYYSKSSSINAGTDISVTATTASTTIDFTTEGNYTQEDSSKTDITGGVGKLAPVACGSYNVLDADGNSYSTVLVGSQCWMGQNMRVGTMIAGTVVQSNNSTIEKYCYGNNSANCTSYGGLYLWDEAMQYSTIDGARGICPSGWHIPTDAEYYTLESGLATGACSSTRAGAECDPAGTALKSGGASGLNFYLAGRSDAYGGGGFASLGVWGFYWTSTLANSNDTWTRYFGSVSTVYRTQYSKTYGNSIRCIKNTGSSYPTTPYYITTTDASQIDVSTYSAITDVDLTQTTPTGTDVKYLVSFDGRTSWKYWTGSAWASSSLANLQSQGMSKTSLEALGSANWSTSGGFVAGTTTTLDFAMDLSTSDSSATPELDQIKVNYTYFGSGEYLISSKYNTEVGLNIMGGINWTEDSTLPVNSQVTMYLRTAVSAVGLDSASWSEVASSTPSFLTSGCTKSTGSITCDTTTIPTALKDGSNDQWFQYKLVINPGVASPTIDNIVPTYVANGAPEVGTFTAIQGTDGVVDISYEIKDADTTSGTVIANYVTPTFEYYNGSSWTAIATSSIVYGSAPVSGEVTDDNSDGYTDNKVLEDSYLTYTATWVASTTIADLYTTGFQMRATFDDKEAANNTVASTTIAGILDTTAPTSTSVIVDGTTSPATLTLAATDDSEKQMMISLNSDFSGASWEAYSTASTIALVDDPDTVYVKFKDAYGNESAVLNVATPAIPNNIVIQDISNVNVTPATYDLFVTWGVIADPGPGFGSYKVYHATDGINFSLESTITDRTLNYYVDRNLTADSTHQYKVLAVDASGNISDYSSSLAGTANGTQDGVEGGGGVEAVAPVITNTASSNITTQSATITWDTDELADSRIEYITATGADFTDAPYVGKASMLNTAAGLGQHSIVLTGLTPNTTYYYQVKSTDINGNMATKVPGDNGFTFDTLAGPAISAVTTDTINNESAIITWTTDTVASSYVYYSTSASLSGAIQTGSADSVTAHSVTISGLSSGTKYYYYVVSGVANDKNIINGEVSYYNLTTTQDSTAPIITFDSDTDITSIGDNSATISWITNEVATSTLEYGISNSYGSIESNNNYNSNHSFNLTGLSAGTTYYIRLKSTDANLNTRTDDNTGSGWTFTTTDSSDVTAPNITTDPSATTIGDTFAYITWVTDEASNSVVDYGTTTGSYTASSSRATLDTSHSIKLSGLTEEIKYYFRVISTDANSNATTSAETFFTTLGALSEEAAVLIREEAARAEGIASAGTGSSYCGTGTSWNGTVCTAPVSSGGGGGASCPVTDRKAPVISDVKVDVGAVTATVSWVTNEDANTIIQYGTGKEYGLIESNPLNSDKTHSLSLKNLYPSNQYFYKVISIDGSGNKAESTQFKFTTLSSIEAVDKDIQEIEDIQENPVITSPTVKTAQESLLQLATQKVNSIFSRMAGQVSVQKLEENLVSTTQTIEDLSKYIPAPLLSSEPNVKVTSSSAIISWGTDKPANSLIELATEAEYNLNKSKPYTETRGEAEELTNSHAVVLYNLSPSTTYHYKLKSKSQVGPVAQSKDFTFTTNAEVPQITKWSVKDVKDHSATFIWETSVEATTEIEYTPYHQRELQKDRMKTKKVPGLSITHEITLDDLDGGATYFVRLKSVTQSGELITHSIPEFNNVDDVIPPQILQLRTDSVVSSEGNKIQTIITWQTDELATSQVFYQEGASVNSKFVVSSELREDLVYRHTTVLGNLKPATVYRFNVQSIDSQGNLAISKDYTLLTPQKKQDVV